MMRRWMALALILAALLGAPGPARADLADILHFNPGQALVERLLSQATGGPVSVTGLTGRFPDVFQIERLELSDRDGVWLVAEGVHLDWSPTRLVRREAAVERFEAARVQVLRLPVSDAAPAPAAAPGDTGSGLPVSIDVQHLRIDRLELAEAVAGAAVNVSVEGRAKVASLESGTADLSLRRLDGEGTYALRGTVSPDSIVAALEIDEAAGGPVARLAALPDLGPIHLRASLNGPRRAAATEVELSAGELSAGAHGTVNLVDNAADLDVSANAPAMQPRPDLSWQSIALQAHVRGPFAKPEATGTLRVERLAAAGASLRLLSADLDGNLGRVGLRATAEGGRIPGPDPALLEAAPLTLQADVQLDDPARPVAFTLSHPLLTATGRAQTGGELAVTADLAVPELAPRAAIGGVDLRGRTKLALHAAVQGTETNIDVNGTIGLTSGLPPAPALLGEDATLALSITLRGADVLVRRAELNGAALHLTANGGLQAGRLDVSAQIGLPKLGVLAPAVAGNADISLHVQGPLDNLSLIADATGEVGTAAVPRGPVRLHVEASGLPGAPTGRITAQGTLDGAPLALDLTARREPDGTLQLGIGAADWRSAHAEGALTLAPGATVPQGRVALRMTRLEDLRNLLGQPIGGNVRATAQLGAAEARIEAEGALADAGARIGRLSLDTRMADPLSRPVVTAHLNLDGVNAGGFTGTLRADVSGPQDALSLRTTAAGNVTGSEVQLTAAAVLDATARQLRLNALQATWQGETARLLAPATLRFADTVSVDRLRLGLRGVVLEAAGRVSPTLDLTASLRGPAADFAAIAGPDLAADGTVALDAKLTGTPAQPGGTVRLNVTGLRMRAGPGRALQAANLNVTAELAGGFARIDGRLTAGAGNQLALSGRAPLGPAGALDLRATGAVNLAVLDPFLAAGGRRVRGRVTLNAAVAGTAAAPRVSGTAQLAGGEVLDYAQGLRLTDITATLRADGDTVRLVSLNAAAGPGTITASGTVGVLAPGLPVDLAIAMHRARPLASDRLSADLDANLTLRGAVQTGLQAAGRITILRAEVRVPERLPVTVATLNVRRPGQSAPTPVAATVPIGLDLAVSAPRAIFVRGRGLDAELEGEVRVRGTSIQPQVSGGFELRRGTFTLAGTTLTFTRGRVSFDGGGLTGRIDPSLDFVAESTAGNVTARLMVGGYASAPKITLSSTPELPPDEVLSYLLFKRSIKELGPFQIASIAAAVADISGVGGGVGDPLDRVRRGLGLDRLSVGGGASGSAPTVEAGRYIGNGIYLGAKQGTTGADTRGTVQIDITKGLKLETELGTGTGGNSVGLTYQFEY